MLPPTEICRFCQAECPAPCNHFTDQATGKTDAVCESCAREIRLWVAKLIGNQQRGADTVRPAGGEPADG